MAHPGSLLKKKYLRTPIYSRPNPSERTGLLVAFSRLLPSTLPDSLSDIRACTTRVLSPSARVKILAVMLDSRPILGLASTQLLALALGDSFSARPRSASVGR
jgi:hypothetical protein